MNQGKNKSIAFAHLGIMPPSAPGMWAQALIWALKKKEMGEMLFLSKNSGSQTIK